jgi:hypothetical protein
MSIVRIVFLIVIFLSENYYGVPLSVFFSKWEDYIYASLMIFTIIFLLELARAAFLKSKKPEVPYSSVSGKMLNFLLELPVIGFLKKPEVEDDGVPEVLKKRTFLVFLDNIDTVFTIIFSLFFLMMMWNRFYLCHIDIWPFVENFRLAEGQMVRYGPFVLPLGAYLAAITVISSLREAYVFLNS